MAQLARQVCGDISVLSSAMATINTTCEDCQFNYWEVIAKFHSKDVLYYQFLKEPSVLGVQCCKWAAVVQWNRCALGSLGSQSSQVDSHNCDHSCEFFKSLSDVTTSSAECHPEVNVVGLHIVHTVKDSKQMIEVMDKIVSLCPFQTI